MASACDMVLDVGQSTRERIDLFERDRIETMEINVGDPLADIIDDICAPNRLQPERYDGIVCLSVLEHVYDPFAAIQEIHRLLQPGGYLLLHLPFLFRYHAPADLRFTDGYRFSRDGMAWMLRDFSEVTLYSIRGPWSSIFNLHKGWKNGIEKRFGMSPARWLDRFAMRFRRRPTSDLQVSGYYAWARK
jgi:SAM-dependent methyltransferase